MKRLVMFFILVPCLSIANTNSGSLITDNIDAVNYSYGFTIGEKILKKQVEFRIKAFSDGLYDALSQKEPRLGEEKMANLLNPDQPVNQKDAGEPPKAFRLPGQKYISENASSDGVVTLPSGLQYKVVKSGTGTETPTLSDTVLVNYKMTTIDGKVFSSTYPLGIPTPQDFPVNKGIAGWTEALLLMHEGDRWEVTIPAHLAYRDTGPIAGQTVIVDLQLLEIVRRNR